MVAMKNILCVGDSNAWGYDASTDASFNHESRWTGILAQELEGKANNYEAGIPDMTFGWDSDLPDRNGVKVVNDWNVELDFDGCHYTVKGH